MRLSLQALALSAQLGGLTLCSQVGSAQPFPSLMDQGAPGLRASPQPPKNANRAGQGLAGPLVTSTSHLWFSDVGNGLVGAVF